MKIGADYLGNGTTGFAVWAPIPERVAVAVDGRSAVPMERDENGCWRAEVLNAPPGTRYSYLLNGSLGRPDPASFHQPEGVHGPSEIVDHGAFPWGDGKRRNPQIEEMIIYELHVGTFTREGTFEAIEERIDHFVELGINAVEFMPVAQFPGERNWGYDGVYPYAVQNSYGGPTGFKKIVNALHARGLAVILDVVYNHLGPEGNYLGDFGPWSTDRYRTPFGDAINFDGPFSDGVRNFFIRNALYWFDRYHVDALRLDAIEQMYDFGARHILEEMRDEVDRYSARAGRRCSLIAESDLNDRRVVSPRESGGYGLDAQWCDDFHHSLHVLLTGERARHYVDFGRCAHLEKSIREGFVYSGDYSVFRKRRHGNSSGGVPPGKFIVFAQNHDQVGNRAGGERLAGLVEYEGLKVAAGTVMVSPHIPLLFMGEEYGEDSPFLYFTSHSDEKLIEGVRKGRERSLRCRARDAAGSDAPGDPQDERLFRRSVLAWDTRTQGHRAALYRYYRRLIELRTAIPALRTGGKDALELSSVEEMRVLTLRRWSGESEIFCIVSFNTDLCAPPLSIPSGRWTRLLDSAEPRWRGPGSPMPERLSRGTAVSVMPRSFTLYLRDGK
jgi:maltooligosyltrehalose trehalohydrolase